MSSAGPPTHLVVAMMVLVFASLVTAGLLVAVLLAALLRRVAGVRARGLFAAVAAALVFVAVALLTVEPQATDITAGQNEEAAFVSLALAVAMGLVLAWRRTPDLAPRRA